ncbi:CsbD family protein [Chromohalobacter canadensis]|uniref:CsbD family protein n=1 Tax=Chromohalobacter canadensis TaxID=141389 RepID=UPI00240ED75C|nr:CsbD family protein [Chromohalobacter canadensis]
MNWDQIEGRWTEVRGKAKASWGEMTDDELDQVAGKRDQLIGKLQTKYGITKEEAEKRADDWARSV